MSNADDRCARPDCKMKRLNVRHVQTPRGIENGWYDHDFVEPAPHADAPHAFVLPTVTAPVGYLLCAVPGCGLRSAAPIHLPVEPAPQPEPSGDEAKVREIADRHCKGVIDFCNIEGFVGVSPHVAINAATREAYAAGKATNPRCAGCGQIHAPCHLCQSGLCSAHQPVEGMVDNITRELATAVRFITDNCTSEAATALVEDMCGYQVVAEAIARRGSGRDMRTNWRGESKVFSFEDVDQARKQGADRERRRIRRTQMDALEGVRLLLAKLDATADLDAAIALTGVLDAATRAKKGKRK